MYHEIQDRIHYLLNNSISTETENFEKHLKFYKENFEVVSMDEIHRETTKTKLVITFDDGYLGNYKYAYPLLKNYNLKALFFITTGFIDKTYFYWILLLKLIESEKKSFFSLSKIDLSLTPLLLKYSLTKIVKRFFKYSYIKKINTINDSKKLMSDFFMNWENIIEINNNELFKIGAHSVSHPILSKLSYEDQRFEIESSINDLEEKIGEKVEDFAYPFGKNEDYNSDSKKILSSLDLNIFTTELGDNSDFDRFEIKRIGIHNDSIEELQSKLKGFT